MSSDKVDRKIDSYIDNIIKTNYNGFASNNNNPFLVSPYAPTANAGIINQINEININISSLNQNISSLFDLSTMTLRISTITNTLYSNTVTISTTNLVMDVPNVYINADNTNITGITNVSTLNASNITFQTLIGSTIKSNTAIISALVFSTLTGGIIDTSLINISTLIFSTLIGSTINTNSVIVKSTINTSSIITRNMYYTSLKGADIQTNSLEIFGITYYNELEGNLITANTINTTTMNFDNMTGSLINTSTISTTNVNFDAILGNKITTSELIFSSICMVPSTILSVVPPVNGFNSSILICLDGSYWQIPIFPV